MPKCVIAEDEALLRAELAAQLGQVAPDLELVAVCEDGAAALEAIAQHQPEFAFLDIRMPGLSGLEVAAALQDTSPHTQVVFVTAYEQHALDAFDRGAVDYLLKPVQPARLQRTVAKLKDVLARRATPGSGGGLDQAVEQLRHLLAGTARPAAPLQVIQASVGTSIRMVPIGEVLVFEAADKYVRVLTEGHEYLIRTPLKDLLPQLDTSQFWQVHRGTVVRASAIESVTRDEAGKLHLAMKGRQERVPVSRLYAHLFKAM